jgi:pimeloyl-ACP methyl ester carboxylesterase
MRDSPILKERHFIAFEQRGAQYAQPEVACREMNDAGATASEHSLDFAQQSTLELAAARICRARLAALGIDLSAYNTSAIADDVNDLRTALHIHKLNVYGLSYSTLVFLDRIRRHPDAVLSQRLRCVGRRQGRRELLQARDE